MKLRGILMARVTMTPEKIIEVNELYLKLGTYSAVSRELGGSPSPSTVKKYIIPNYVSKKDISAARRTYHIEDLPDFDIKEYVDLIKSNNWGEVCVLSEEENAEVEELWKELEY
jgi:hypothetical protein